MENELLAGQTEDVVLGAMLAYPDKCLDFIRAAGLKEADFYKASNKTLFREIMKMADRGEAVELNTVAADLQQSGEPAGSGGGPLKRYPSGADHLRNDADHSG